MALAALAASCNSSQVLILADEAKALAEQVDWRNVQ